jgi:hypothetical protein
MLGQVTAKPVVGLKHNIAIGFGAGIGTVLGRGHRETRSALGRGMAFRIRI